MFRFNFGMNHAFSSIAFFVPRFEFDFLSVKFSDIYFVIQSVRFSNMSGDLTNIRLYLLFGEGDNKYKIILMLGENSHKYIILFIIR
jgi:hypothetical protein